MYYSRPKLGETEDDLLRMQEEYFKNKADKSVKPAATVINASSCDTGNETHKSNTQGSDTCMENINEQLANTFEAIPSDVNLKQICEKKSTVPTEASLKFEASRGFPKPQRRDSNIIPGKRGSIFSQQVKRLKKSMPMEVDNVNNTFLPQQSVKIRDNSECSSKVSAKILNKLSLPSKSYVLTGSDSQDIHEENLTRINNMTEEEILEEREKLLATMDPAVVAFLKSRRKNESNQTRNLTIKEQNEAGKEFEIEHIETPAEIITKPEAENWLNFNVIETNKLAWMKNVDVPKIEKNKPFEARFDFEGWLLPYSEPEINEKNRVLYHHGEEAGRPGYSLQELFQLSRSSVIQQKIIALNCIANILSINSTGAYDEVIDLPMEQIFFVVRFCLDDNTPAVLNASIKAMRNLIFIQLDETCLDNLLGFGLGMVQPMLAVDNEHEDDSTVNDQQLVEKNMTKCLARTEIFTRIRYVINTVKPPLETIVYCMDILGRLARDNDLILNKLCNTEGLIDSIVKHFVPKQIVQNTENPGYGTPLVHAVKLLRILSCRGRGIASKLLARYNLMEILIVYLSDERFSLNANGMKLQVECLHLMSLFVHYGLGLEYLSVLEQPVVLKLLDYHFRNTELNSSTTLVRQSHTAAVFIFIGQMIKKEYNISKELLFLLVNMCLPKWSKQFCQLPEFSCGKLQIISSLLLCVSSLQQHQPNPNIDEIVMNIIESNGMKAVTQTIKNGSMLLNNFETHKTSANLLSLEAAAWHSMDHVVPVMKMNSCIPFLYCLSEYALRSRERQVKMAVVNQANLKEYLLQLQNSKHYFLTNNWFSRPESFMLINILKISVDIKDSIDTSIFYELAVKCLSVFNCEQKADIEYLLKKIIFCPSFYPSDILLQHLDISLKSESLEISLNNLEHIKEVYTVVLGLQKDLVDLSLSLTVDTKIGNVIPIDWIYTPIIVLYSNQLQNKAVSEEYQIFTIKNCLRWILIYETYFPFLADTINPTDRFCRLACVFLGSDSLFLNKEIHALLEQCFRNLIKFEKDLNFKKGVQGLSNFQDFYTQLLEQYQGVSYGDTLFGNVILVPLAQKHNVQYRKTLWSEYMGAVQIFNVTPEQVLCDLQLYLEPPEEDISLINCYQRAIAQNTVRKHSVLYKIASYHVEQYRRRLKQQR